MHSFIKVHFRSYNKLKTAKDFCISIYSNLRKVIYHVIFIILLLITNFSIYSYLKHHQQVLETIILKDFQQAFIRYIKEEITWELLDIIANKNSSNLDGSSSIYKMNTDLDRIFSSYIYYEVKANDIVLAANIYSKQESLALAYDYALDKDVNCSINISKNPDSQYFKNITTESESIIFIITGVFALINILTAYSMFLKIKDIKVIEKQKLIYDKITNYQKIKKKITTQSHNYFMSTRQQILAIPLLIKGNEQNFTQKAHDIDLTALSIELKEYAIGYIALQQNSIALNIHCGKNMLLNVNTDPEIFSQIVFSVLCNILYFIKNLSEVNITILFDHGFIEFSYDKAFPINDEILRINSDPASVTFFLYFPF